MNGRQIVALVIGSLAAGCASGPPPTHSLEERLNDLKNEPQPPESGWFDFLETACCYAPPASPIRYDIQACTYLCPQCGRKTLYRPTHSLTLNQYNSIVNASRWKECQQLVEQMQPAAKTYGLHLSLDTRDLCSFCSKKNTGLMAAQKGMNNLYLIVRKQDGTVTCNSCNEDDLTILHQFLTTTDWKQPTRQYGSLRNHVPTIERLLNLHFD